MALSLKREFPLPSTKYPELEGAKGFRALRERFAAGKPITVTGRNILARAGMLGEQTPYRSVTDLPTIPATPYAQRQLPVQPPPMDLMEATQQKIWEKRDAGLFGKIAATPEYKVPQGMTWQGAQTIRGLRQPDQLGLLGTMGGYLQERKKMMEALEAKGEKKQEALEQRRQNAIREYIDFKQKIIAEGGTPDVKAGQDLINAIQQSDNPEVELSNYFSTAAPFVQKLFAPKRTGGGGSGGVAIQPEFMDDVIADYVKDIESGNKNIMGIPARFRTQVQQKIQERKKLREEISKMDITTGIPSSLMIGYDLGIEPSKLKSGEQNLELKQMISEAKSALKDYQAGSSDWKSVREQIIERAKTEYNVDLTPYL